MVKEVQVDFQNHRGNIVGGETRYRAWFRVRLKVRIVPVVNAIPTS